jgi:hypothetical protein
MAGFMQLPGVDMSACDDSWTAAHIPLVGVSGHIDVLKGVRYMHD